MWSRIEQRYERAQRLGIAFKTPTKVELIKDNTTEANIVVRISEALKQKPTKVLKKDCGNPFLPYDEDLWVMDLSETHVLLLNKFNLVDRHVLVVTKEFEDQNTPLSMGDVTATWKTLKCMPEGGIAFFNSGQFSGASQPHKHTQIVPLPLSEASPLPLDAVYKKALRQGKHLQMNLPFCAFGVELSSGADVEWIHEAYEEMLATAKAQIRKNDMSYNVIWTKEWFVLIPRRAEKNGLCSLNALGFAGTFFVKSADAAIYVREQGAFQILQNVAFPNPGDSDC